MRRCFFILILLVTNILYAQRIEWVVNVYTLVSEGAEEINNYNVNSENNFFIPLKKDKILTNLGNKYGTIVGCSLAPEYESEKLFLRHLICYNKVINYNTGEKEFNAEKSSLISPKELISFSSRIGCNDVVQFYSSGSISINENIRIVASCNYVP